ncbi:MAG: hypothetical protein JWR15_2229, partial [Prosthecobacter sp.]|nr:hypothetical protein [Prosthecobacter sp.]
QPVVELAAITTPMAPAPRRPSGHVTAQQRKPSGISAAPVAESKSKLIKNIAIIGGVVVLLGIGGCYFFGKSGGNSGSGKSTLSSMVSANPSKVSFQLPQDRAFPPVDAGISLFYVGNTGILTNRKGGDGKTAQANINEPVMEWHDLSDRGGDNILRSHDKSPDYAPKRANWPEAPKGGTPRAGRTVLDFHPRNGKPCVLELDDTGNETQSMPFGTKNVSVPNDKGLTAVITFQADATKLPMRVFTLSNDDGTTVSLRVDENKNLVAEVKHEGGSPTLTSKDVNGTLACIAFITWNTNTGAVELRVKDADGKSFTSSGGKSTAPYKPLSTLLIGRDKDSTAENVGSENQFVGYLAEFFVYSIVLKPDQMQLADKGVRDYYLMPTAPAALNTRLKTKLAWIEPRGAWRLSASHKKEDLSKAVDNQTASRWSTGAAMKGGEWFIIELPTDENIAGLALDSQGNYQDYLRKYKIELSSDGTNWGAPVAQGDGSAVTEIVFKAPQKARFVRITQLGSASNPWGINELVLFKK